MEHTNNAGGYGSDFQKSSEDFLKSKWRSAFEFFVELIKVTVICATIIIAVRFFLFQPFIVKGQSMEPNFYDGDYLIIYQLPYRFPEVFKSFSEEDRGISIIFHPPNAEDQFYIKRLVGLPGEEVEIKEGKVTVYNDHFLNGFVLDELYLEEGLQTIGKGDGKLKLGMNEVYVLGDNRGRSFDSRQIGPIPIKNVVGRPVLRSWPIYRAGIIK